MPASSLRLTGRFRTKQTASRARARSSGSAPATQTGTRGRPMSSSSRSKPSCSPRSSSPGTSAPSTAVDTAGAGKDAGIRSSSATREHHDRAEGFRLDDGRLAEFEQFEEGEKAGHRLKAGGYSGRHGR